MYFNDSVLIGQRSSSGGVRNTTVAPLSLLLTGKSPVPLREDLVSQSLQGGDIASISSSGGGSMQEKEKVAEDDPYKRAPPNENDVPRPTEASSFASPPPSSPSPDPIPYPLKQQPMGTPLRGGGSVSVDEEEEEEEEKRQQLLLQLPLAYQGDAAKASLTPPTALSTNQAPNENTQLIPLFSPRQEPLLPSNTPNTITGRWAVAALQRAVVSSSAAAAAAAATAQTQSTPSFTVHNPLHHQSAQQHEVTGSAPITGGGHGSRSTRLVFSTYV